MINGAVSQVKVVGSRFRSGVLLALVLGTLLTAAPAHAQAAAPAEPPLRSSAWSTATNITALSAMGLVLLTPRVFYSDPEVNAGWKARFHLSVLAPSMTLAAASLFNESSFKNTLEGYRPGCDEETQGGPGCASYGMFSTPTFAAFSAFGQGTGIFLTDTLKWSGGRFNFGSFFGDVLAPATLSVITAVGRTSGNWESGGQVWSSAGLGMVTGLGLGVLYATMQRPECGYTGSLICW